MREAKQRGFGLPVFRFGNRWRPRFPRLQMGRATAMLEQFLKPVDTPYTTQPGVMLREGSPGSGRYG